jgi:hypothetical protein
LEVKLFEASFVAPGRHVDFDSTPLPAQRPAVRNLFQSHADQVQHRVFLLVHWTMRGNIQAGITGIFQYLFYFFSSFSVMAAIDRA